MEKLSNLLSFFNLVKNYHKESNKYRTKILNLESRVWLCMQIELNVWGLMDGGPPPRDLLFCWQGLRNKVQQANPGRVDVGEAEGFQFFPKII